MVDIQLFLCFMFSLVLFGGGYYPQFMYMIFYFLIFCHSFLYFFHHFYGIRVFYKTSNLMVLLWTELFIIQNLCVEALTPSVTAFEDRAFKQVIRLVEVIGGALIL